MVPTTRGATLKRFLSATGLVIFAAAALAAPARAASPHEVDPSTMTPTLNPNFAPWTCFESGNGITCKGEMRNDWVNEDSGMSCAGQPIYTTGSGWEFATRWHTADGRATRTVVHLDYRDRFTLSPVGDGPSVNGKASWGRHYTYAIPGATSSRTLTEVGNWWVITSPGSGIVFHDTGLVEYETGQDFEEIAVAHGIHDSIADDGAAESAICGALS